MTHTQRHRATRHLAVAAFLGLPFSLPFVMNACSWWDGAQDGDASSPSIACPSGAVSVSIPAAYAVPATSGSTNVSIGGTATGCPVFGVLLYGAIPASSVGSSYGTWSTTIPLTVFESQDAGTTTLNAEAGVGAASCAGGGYAVPVQVLVTLDSGVNGWVQEPTQCVPLLGDLGCDAATASFISAYPAPASSTGTNPSVVVAGTVSSPTCPVQGVLVDGVYSATPVVPGYGAWTATVPLTVFQATQCPAKDAAPGTYSPSVQVLVPGSTGLATWTPVQAGCVELASSFPGCTNLAVSVNGSAYPAAASSTSPASLTLSGVVDAGGCPVSALSLLNTYVATPVAPNFAEWTATVPLATLEQQAPCSTAADAALSYQVSAQLLVPGGTGLSVWQNVPEAGCVTVSGAPVQACANPVVTVNPAAPPASSATPATQFMITGNVQTGPCPVAGVVVLSAYSATALASDYASWSAVVPAPFLQAQPTCSGGAGTPDGGYGVTYQLIVPGNDGLPVALEAGCQNVFTPP